MFGALGFEDASTTGISVGVPGTLRGVNTALKNWGTITLAQAVAPAISLAESGFTVGAFLASDIVNTSDRGFVMSDHTDWPGLIRTIEETGAKRVLAMHGNTEALLQYLSERGIAAEALQTAFQGEAGAAAPEDASA